MSLVVGLVLYFLVALVRLWFQSAFPHRFHPFLILQRLAYCETVKFVLEISDVCMNLKLIYTEKYTKGEVGIYLYNLFINLFLKHNKKILLSGRIALQEGLCLEGVNVFFKVGYDVCSYATLPVYCICCT